MEDNKKNLAQMLSSISRPVKGIPFEVAIEGIYEIEVEKFIDTEYFNQDLVNKIIATAKSVCQEIKQNPIIRPRPNEVGNDIEPYVIKYLKEEGLDADTPRTKSGKKKSTGYPDIKINFQPFPIYLEVKTYALKNHATTQRSFYLSPSEDPKVTEKGFHLLIGFEIENEGQKYTPVAYELIDLYGLECDVKFEFNSDNKRLYEKKRMITSGRVDN